MVVVCVWVVWVCAMVVYIVIYLVCICRYSYCRFHKRKLSQGYLLQASGLLSTSLFKARVICVIVFN